MHSGRHPTERAGVYASPFRPVWSSVGRSTRKVHGKFDRRQPSSSRAPQVWRCLPLEPLAPVSVRWLQENLGKHRCQCGCGLVIDLQARHYRHGIPRFTHGHHNRRGHWRVLQLREAGYLTISEVAKALGIGTTTLRRREGTIYPPASRIGGIRVYHVGGRRAAPTPGRGAANGSRRETALALPAQIDRAGWRRARQPRTRPPPPRAGSDSRRDCRSRRRNPRATRKCVAAPGGSGLFTSAEPAFIGDCPGLEPWTRLINSRSPYKEALQGLTA